MQTQTCDEPSDTEADPQVSGSVEELYVQQNKGVGQRHTKTAARLIVSVQNQALVDRPPQFEEGGAQQRNSVQITNSGVDLNQGQDMELAQIQVRNLVLSR